MDIILQTLQAIGYVVLLVVLVFLWRRALRPAESRNFWRFLALAWTMNLLGNVAWIVHDLVTGTTLATFSVIDLFYVSRYVLIALALWLYPAPLPRRTWLWIGGTMLAAIALVWLIYFDRAMSLRPGDWAFFMGLTLYPVLDVGSVVLGWLRVRATQASVWRRYAVLLFCAVTSYGIANTMYFTEDMFGSISGGVLPNMFWILTDIFLLVMVLRADVQAESPSLMRVQE